MTVTLTDADAQAVAVLLRELLHQSAVAGRPTPAPMWALWRRLRLAVDTQMSASGQQFDAALPELLTTSQAAEALGWCERRTRRHAADLDGQRIGRSWMFPAKAVRDYMKCLEQERNPPL